MTSEIGEPTTREAVEFAQQEDRADDSSTYGAVQPHQRILDSLFGNPRFSVPANDHPDLLRLTPRSQNCREAELLRMWV
ncbi:MAG: hypothetical protein ACR2OM_09680, partial [Aestuariivirgaceae bacterium]